MKSTKLSFAPPQIDIALLLLRVLAGFSLLLGHGLQKLTGFHQMAAHFPDPLHIGPVATLAYAVFAETVCAILIMLGLGTRIAAAIIVIDVFSAFCLVHHFALSGPGSGELAWLYSVISLVLILTGGGRFSMDELIRRTSLKH